MPSLPSRQDALLARALASAAEPLTGGVDELTPLLDEVGDERLVLIGEATHGTHEFYRLRAELTKRLIVEKGFHAVAVEGDWPDCYRVNRFVRGEGTDTLEAEALADFRRFPSWMWRNAEVMDFVGWLRAHNDRSGMRRGNGGTKVGFYGLDLYSLHASMAAVLGYLEARHPTVARRVRDRYACFDAHGEDAQAYGHAVHFSLEPSCQEDVHHALLELQRARAEHIPPGGVPEEDEHFFAEQNARVVKNAEEYYRAMFSARVSGWNLRDLHMATTLDGLLTHLDRRVGRSRVVVWAHNSHVGDARATEMGWSGELNLGQLARQRHKGDVLVVGFTTHAGTVTAARDWDAPAERLQVRPSRPDSYERLFHLVGIPSFLLDLRRLGEGAGGLREPRLERAIGVVYRPTTERASHYFRTRIADQFDFVLHVDETRALEPLERSAEWLEGEAPETFPTGL